MTELPECYYSMKRKELRKQLLFQINQNIKIVTQNHELVDENDKWIDTIIEMQENEKKLISENEQLKKDLDIAKTNFEISAR